MKHNAEQRSWGKIYDSYIVAYGDFHLDVLYKHKEHKTLNKRLLLRCTYNHKKHETLNKRLSS